MFPDGMAENHVPLACLDEPSFTFELAFLTRSSYGIIYIRIAPP